MHRNLIVLLTTSLTVLACTHQQSTYQRTHNQEDLRRVLLNDIKPGDSLGRVEQILGKGVKATPLQSCLILRSMRCTEEKSDYRYAESYRETDTFFHYRYDKCSAVVLQFREGQLINHVPSEYADPQALHFVTNLKAN